MHPRENTVGALFDLQVSRAPHHVIFRLLEDGFNESASIDFTELRRRSLSLGQFFAKNFQRGDRILLVCPNEIDFMIGFLGCAYSGMVAVPMDVPSHRRSERFLGIIEDCSPAAIYQGQAGQVRLSRLLRDSGIDDAKLVTESDAIGYQCMSPVDVMIREEDVAFLQYTSGSTGQPKGARISHKNFVHNQKLAHAWESHCPGDHTVTWLPMYHDMGLATAFNAITSLRTCVIIPNVAFVRNPSSWLKAISKYKASVSLAPNFAFNLMLKQPEDQLKDLDLTSWTFAGSGAEPIEFATISRFAEHFKNQKFHIANLKPCYGLAEATVAVAGTVGEPKVVVADKAALESGRLESSSGLISILETPNVRPTETILVASGKPLIETRIIVLDQSNGQVLEDGFIGEICVQSDSVSDGYWNRSEENEKLFYHDDNQGKFVRTGDLGFMLNGHLFVTGRSKDLIIIRGRNIYPHDIERLSKSSVESVGISLGATAAFAHETGAEESVVIVQEIPRKLEDLFNLDVLKEMIREAVEGELAIQVRSIILVAKGAIPLTTSGKVRRSLCKKMVERREMLDISSTVGKKKARDDQSGVQTGSTNEIEIIAWLKREIGALVERDLSQVAADSSLFGLGLDSISLIQLQGKIKGAFHVDIGLEDLFDLKTLQDLAGLIVRSKPKAEEEETSLWDSWPLSVSQQGIYLAQQLDQYPEAFHIGVKIEICGDFSESEVKKAFELVQLEQIGLRRVIGMRHDNPHWIELNACQLDWAVADFSHEEKAADRAMSYLNEQIRLPFKLQSEPPFRVRLAKKGPGTSTIGVFAHHIVADGWSLGLVVDRWFEIMEELRNDSYSPKPVKRLGAEQVVETHVQYWREQLHTYQPFKLPSKPHDTSDSRSAELRIDTTLADTQAIKSLCRELNTSCYAFMLSVFKLTLSRFSGRDDIVVGSPFLNRKDANEQRIVDMKMNVLGLRSRLSGGNPFGDYLASIGNLVKEALKHQAAPLESVSHALGKTLHDPIFDVLCIYHNYHPLKTFQRGTDLAAVRYLELGYSNYRMVLEGCEEEGKLKFLLRYRLNAYDQGFVDEFFEFFSQTLKVVATRPGILVDEIRSHDLGQLFGQGRASDYRIEEGYASLFRKVAAQNPQKIAVAGARSSLSFAELDEMSDRLAFELVHAGVQKGDRVAVYLERSVDFALSIVAVLKAGGVFIPVDASYPLERIRHMIEDSGAKRIVTKHKYVNAGLGVEAIVLDLVLQKRQEYFARELPAAGPHDAAYIVYTSGSTGTPKGAINLHLGMINHIYGQIEALNLKEHFVFLQSAPASSDIAIWQYLGPLLAGGTCVVLEDLTDISQYFVLIERFKVNLVELVPSVLNMLLYEVEQMEEKRKALLSLQYLMVTGENVPRNLVNRWLKFFANIPVVNAYGPSETADDVCQEIIYEPIPETQSRVSIGRPLPNIQVYVMDEALRTVPPMVQGEIVVGGICIGAGYYQRPELNREKFVQHEAYGRLYRTGDVGYWDKTGKLYFVGRMDRQVKVKGRRIELAEIESVLESLTGVDLAVVKPFGQDGTWSGLWGFIQGSASLSEQGVKDDLATLVPDYMVPDFIEVCSSFPRMPNGKIDVDSLKISRTDRPDVITSKSEAALQFVVKLYADVFDNSNVTANSDFLSLGGNSIMVTTILAKIQSEFGVAVSPKEFFDNLVVSQLASLISSRVKV
jgi:amino acid adenylation domain-containing protein